MNSNQPEAYRTLFVVDCSASFRNTNCGVKYTIDVVSKNRQTSHALLPPINKSLYTCAIEAIFEYSRIVWDLFPNGERLIQVACCLQKSVKFINTLDVSQQSYEALTDSFYRFSSIIAREGKASDINQTLLLTSGFYEALMSLHTTESNNRPARIILISTFIQDTLVQSLISSIKQVLDQYAENVLKYISHLDIVLINTVEVLRKSPYLGEIERHRLSDHIYFTLNSVASGPTVAAKFVNLAFDHFFLASTTVAGIPMKEEQNAGSSANYDVSIIHSKKAHDLFFSYINEKDPSSYFSNINRDGQLYHTLKLNWCTVRAGSIESNHCIGAHRITSVDVNSRPSTCLINFLHSGKSVSLEMQRPNGKMLSHMLQVHNGELFIHVLSNARSLIEDPPSITEGFAGRVTDYRINEFADFMRKHRLVKSGNPAAAINTISETGTSSLERAKALMNKPTLFFPLSYSFTIFFNIREPFIRFYQLISRERLSDNQVLELKNIIFTIINSENKTGTAFSLISNVICNKNLKKQDFYRILWNEVEYIVRCYNNSPQHQAVLQCILECKPKYDGTGIVSNQATNLVTSNLPNSTSVIRLATENGTVKNQHLNENTTTITTTIMNKIDMNSITMCNVSLQALYLNKINQKNLKRRREFQGRINNEGKIAKLYPELVADEK